MAGDWIDIDLDLSEKRETLFIAEVTGCSVDTVVGRLVRFWAWIHRNCVTEALPKRYRCVLIKLFGGDETFLQALLDSEWLVENDENYLISGFENRFSATAKIRSQTRKRKAVYDAKQKEKNKQALRKRYDGNGERPLEKRTEEKNNNPLTPSFVFPKELDTHEFREAWEAWEQHRIEIKKKITPLSRTRAINVLVPLGPAEAVRWIDWAISRGWQGLYKPDYGKTDKEESVLLSPPIKYLDETPEEAAIRHAK